MKLGNKLLAFLTVFMMVLGNINMLPALAMSADDQVEEQSIKCFMGTVLITKNIIGDIDYDGPSVFTFVLTNKETGQTFTGTETGEGICVIPSVPFGTYTLQETNMPDGFKFHSFVGSCGVISELLVCLPSEAILCNNIRTANIQIIKEDGSGKKLSGAQFELYEKVCDQWKLVNLGFIPTTGSNGISNITGLPFGEYKVKEIKAPMGYTINTELSASLCLNQINDTKTVTFVDTQKFGDIAIHKTVVRDEGDISAIPSFTVEITGPSDNPNVVSQTKQYTISEGTENTISGLAYGTYSVTEVTTPGYSGEPDISPDSFVIGDETQTGLVIEITNTKLYGAATITKVVTNFASSATFQIRLTGTDHEQTVYNKVIDVPANDADGVPVQGLPYGTYTIAEETIPDGYRLVSISPESGFEINGDMTSANITVTNEAFGSIKIVKIDSRSTATHQIPVPGTHFEVYYLSEGAKVFVLKDGVTGEDGTLVVGDLQPGRTYYAHETKQAPGYNLIEATRTFALNVPSTRPITAAEGPFINDPIGQITVEKKDSVSGALLGGFEFGIYATESDANKDTNRLDKITTASSGASLGKATSKHLILTADITSFWVKELSVTDGYTLATAARKVDITFTGKSVPVSTVTLANDPFIRLVINKYDASTVVNANYDTATKLAGAVFGIYKDSACTQQVGANLTTGSSPLGTVSVNLPFGGTNPSTYYVKELTAPTGYILGSASPVAVTYAQNDTPGKTVTLNITNPRNVGSIIIKKIDALDNTKTLANAKFALYSDAELKTQVGAVVTTGSDGMARFDNLAPGSYYLKETAAPKDYDLPAKALPVTVTAGVTSPDPLVITNQYNPPDDIATGMMDYNIMLLGGLALAGGSSLVLFTRKKRNVKK